MEMVTALEKVLIVEDEIHARTGLTELIESWGYRAECAADGVEGLERAVQWGPSIVVTDLKMPRMDGMELLGRLGELPQKIAVVMLTAQGSIDSAVEAMRMGAYDYIPKPVDPVRLRTILQNASLQHEVDVDPETTKRVVRDSGRLGPLVGSSPKMKEIFSLIERVAPSNVSVLVTGENGTLLLDEIGEMPAATQAKVLRVLEDRKLRRLGSKVETPVDVRVVAATNKDPEQAVATGELRGDLYYRLNVFNIQMPPLREHVKDVSAIAEQMIADMNERHGCTVTGVKDSLLKRLEEYSWPGNVRELRNTIERAVILAGSGMLAVEHLPPHFGEPGFAPPPTRVAHGDGLAARTVQSSEVQRYLDESNSVRVEVGTTVDEAERQLILKTLHSTHNNKTKAAEILGISSKTLQNKLKEYSNTAAATE